MRGIIRAEEPGYFLVEGVPLQGIVLEFDSPPALSIVHPTRESATQNEEPPEGGSSDLSGTGPTGVGSRAPLQGVVEANTRMNVHN